ncbi:hypothetical protein A1Q1_05688 [Trichosporon asahii var. asahii CBS 2479]|uniref:Uncharacterized protein n=1 Tax=Trichosporon asahii var. asahii (strain ATCC 90039 / CBS 2479 / JCM 2466 / KCTC 7840 / NBRC 103889/ NCYC 2677 / UAMH 7654) TaxID=1186058 RepID=J6ET01_TRIAS|nr:hypothetical protein A1Q1_05688 [Trichosporon asahii var. asahii CBS 2479]EJT45882.1 hypothetical protein A1Q1_05688 [Trichosporon asahii var. asahii CBS 2479]
MVRYKVRQTREAVKVPCATEIAALLMCFSATGDIRATSEGASGCASAMRNLHKCMEKGGGGGKGRASSVSIAVMMGDGEPVFVKAIWRPLGSAATPCAREPANSQINYLLSKVR